MTTTTPEARRPMREARGDGASRLGASEGLRAEPDAIELEDEVASHHWQLANAVRGVGTRTGGAGPARTLLVVGGVLVGLGVILIVLAWIGAANTTDVFEQIPYMISGGLLGLALVFIGGFCYFTFWQTELVHAARREAADTRAVLDSLRRIESLLAEQRRR